MVAVQIKIRLQSNDTRMSINFLSLQPQGQSHLLFAFYRTGRDFVIDDNLKMLAFLLKRFSKYTILGT